MSDALKVAVDMLREAGHDEEARWLEHADSMRLILRRWDEECPDEKCGVVFAEEMHENRCSVMEALWRVMPTHEAVVEWIDRAHYHAYYEGQYHYEAPWFHSDGGAEWQNVDPARYALSTTPAARMQQVLAMAESGLLPHAAARVLLDYPANADSRLPSEENQDE